MRSVEVVLAELFEIDEEKCLVSAVVQFGYPNRAAEREAVIVAAHTVADVLPVRWIGAVGAVLGASVGKGQTGVQSFIHKIVVAAAMELVGAGFHRVVEISAGRLPVFRIEVAGLNGDFLNGVHATLAVLLRNLPDVAGRVLPFNRMFSLLAGRPFTTTAVSFWKAVPGRRIIACRGLRMLPMPVAAPAAVGCENRQLVNVVRSHRVADFAAFRLHQRRLARSP